MTEFCIDQRNAGLGASFSTTRAADDARLAGNARSSVNRRIAYLVIGVLLGLTSGFINGLLIANLPQIQGALGLTNVEGGWLTAAYSMTNVCVSMMRIDALDDAEIRGRIEEVAPAAGNEFQIIKSDDATGNFVKIPQRITIRILPDRSDPLYARMRPGISVECASTRRTLVDRWCGRRSHRDGRTLVNFSPVGLWGCLHPRPFRQRIANLACMARRASQQGRTA